MRTKKKTPAKKAAPRSSVSSTTRRSTSVTTPIGIVLDLLRSMRHPGPVPLSKIKSWFSDCERIDKELNIPRTRTDVFIVGLFKAPPFHGVSLGKSELLDGQFKTPQAIANLAG